MRKAIESLYDSTCTVIEYQKVRKENKSTGFDEVPVLKDIPCRLSYSNITNTNITDKGAAQVVQIIKVFLAPDINIKPGSKLSITKDGHTQDFKSSGEPAMYDSHQEIVLELFKGWS